MLVDEMTNQETLHEMRVGSSVGECVEGLGDFITLIREQRIVDAIFIPSNIHRDLGNVIVYSTREPITITAIRRYLEQLFASLGNDDEIDKIVDATIKKLDIGD